MCRIGLFASLCGGPAVPLRSHDEIGLLKPSFVDPVTGYRYYGAEQIEVARSIADYKALGFSLEAIGSLLHEPPDPDQFRAMLQSQRDTLRGQLDEIAAQLARVEALLEDQKSTRLNSSHVNISYAVFCLKKKIFILSQIL